METLMAKLLDKKLNPIISSLDDIKYNMNQTEESIAFLNNKYDELNAKVKKIECKNYAISQDNGILQAEIQRSLNIINREMTLINKNNIRDICDLNLVASLVMSMRAQIILSNRLVVWLESKFKIVTYLLVIT